MKKLLIIVLVLFCTGCYDYNELNDLEIVSSLIVDYKEDKYVVNIEVLDTSESAPAGSYFLSGEGFSLEEALNSIYFDSASTPFFSHMKTLILSKNVAEDGIDKFLDFLLRNTQFRRDFYIFVTEDVDSILDFETEPKESIGEMARMNAKRNLEDNGRYLTSTLRDVAFNYLRDNYYMIGSVEVIDDKITLEDTYLFIDNKMTFKVDKDAVLLENLLMKNNNRFQTYGEYTYEIHEYKFEKEIKKDKIVFTLKGHARLLDTKENDSLDDVSLDKLEKELNGDLEKTGQEIIDYGRRLDHDMFNFNYYYYLYFPKLVESDTWKNIDIEFKADLTISEKGLLLNSLGGSKNGE